MRGNLSKYQTKHAIRTNFHNIIIEIFTYRKYVRIFDGSIPQGFSIVSGGTLNMVYISVLLKNTNNLYRLLLAINEKFTSVTMELRYLKRPPLVQKSTILLEFVKFRENLGATYLFK